MSYSELYCCKEHYDILYLFQDFTPFDILLMFPTVLSESYQNQNTLLISGGKLFLLQMLRAK